MRFPISEYCTDTSSTSAGGAAPGRPANTTAITVNKAAHKPNAILRIRGSSVGMLARICVERQAEGAGTRNACAFGLPLNYNDRMFDFREIQHDALHRCLQQHVDGEVRFDAATRNLYSTDASIYQIKPAGVVIPKSVDGLLTAVRIALEMRVPVTARGG